MRPKTWDNDFSKKYLNQSSSSSRKKKHMKVLYNIIPWILTNDKQKIFLLIVAKKRTKVICLEIFTTKLH